MQNLLNLLPFCALLANKIAKGNWVRTSPLPLHSRPQIIPSFLLISLVPGYRSRKVGSEPHARIDPEKTFAYYYWGVGKV